MSNRGLSTDSAARPVFSSFPYWFYTALCTVTLALSAFVGVACVATSATDVGDRPAQLDKIFPRAAQFKLEQHPKHSAVLRIALLSSGDGSVTSAEWCGPRILRFYFGYSDYIGDMKIPKEHGAYLMDIESRTVWRLRPLPGGGELVNCSIDGEWLIYARTVGKDMIVGRYHSSTAKREDFAHFKDIRNSPNDSRLLTEGVWSPDGKKIAYGWKKDRSYKNERTGMGGIQVETRFSPGQLADFRWLGDSTRVILRYFSKPLRSRISHRR